MFDGEIGNASPSIKALWRDDGIGRAHRHASAAFSAVILDNSIVYGQWSVGINFAEKKPRPGILIEQQRVFANPAESIFPPTLFPVPAPSP